MLNLQYLPGKIHRPDRRAKSDFKIIMSNFKSEKAEPFNFDPLSDLVWYISISNIGVRTKDILTLNLTGNNTIKAKRISKYCSSSNCLNCTNQKKPGLFVALNSQFNAQIPDLGSRLECVQSVCKPEKGGQLWLNCCSFSRNLLVPYLHAVQWPTVQILQWAWKVLNRVEGAAWVSC